MDLIRFRRRVVAEIQPPLLVSGRATLVVTADPRIPYNRLKLIFGGTVNGRFDYFFDMCAEDDLRGSHREYTRAELNCAVGARNFRVR